MRLFFRSIGIFVLITVLLASMGSKTFILVHFYSNRDSIAQEKCENKEKPELKCNGKCYLAKQLQAAEEKKDEKAPAPSITLPELIFVQSAQNDFSVFLSEEMKRDLLFPDRSSKPLGGYISISAPPPWM